MIQAVSITGVKINLIGFRNNKDGWVTLSFQFQMSDDEYKAIVQDIDSQKVVSTLDGKHALEKMYEEYPEGMGVLTFGMPEGEAQFYIDGERSDIPTPMF